MRMLSQCNGTGNRLREDQAKRPAGCVRLLAASTAWTRTRENQGRAHCTGSRFDGERFGSRGISRWLDAWRRDIHETAGPFVDDLAAIAVYARFETAGPPVIEPRLEIRCRRDPGLRGPQQRAVRKCLWLRYRLQRQAPLHEAALAFRIGPAVPNP
jgi:hypothetical protein